jgi:hypothetical protein
MVGQFTPDMKTIKKAAYWVAYQVDEYILSTVHFLWVMPLVIGGIFYVALSLMNWI